ncbi:bifunctional hydroxymethylpyrimidine kinase/phosphomethylpyrimidine kinase [Weissella diestrammenae]|uniref:Hydroxymethylpyrimidine/phosphomethylpyrimidine kinase n=1 Tax=Weissella diestrammenae TaxID=1162633 RepID=A0A7G9T6Y4_9LACO|nr:bifunctional hydroxymethylpyrimidine kinase/phosphomethylpyrimidine kinase [Weissella diestrammenae]MCM0582544.1 bifunctional hydroxymethylpyrimidine kinase/phosphomethylpyrimidine kinase [Weissella diestrammenae]QNN75859.1 bifunctional hydroxymethylpyrimidine kinase/phosphomethylpyrimidine kinase [Weissella diestrammenae]
MTNSTPQVMTIAGIDSSGGAGMSADLKTFTMNGVYGANVVVSITAQNTTGVQSVEMVSPTMVAAQLKSVADDLHISAVKTGMLGDAQTVTTVAKAIQTYDFGAFILDPVMVAKGGAHLLEDSAVTAVIQNLLPLSTLVTPNLPEAEVLTGTTIQSDIEIAQAAHQLQQLGAKNVLIKGGHGDEPVVRDYVLLADQSAFWLESQRFATIKTHGTGDTISAAITARLALGDSLKAAIIYAKHYVDATIRQSINVGHGHGPLNHWATMDATQDRINIVDVQA